MSFQNITPQALAATFAEFLAQPERDGEFGNMYWSLADSGIQFPGDVDDLISTLACDSADDDLLYCVEELADKLSDAAATLRGLIAVYFAHRGAILQATNAVEAFLATPTDVNLLALVKASEALDGHPIPMPRALKARIRPFVAKRWMRDRLNFGSLHYIAKSSIKIDTLVQQAA